MGGHFCKNVYNSEPRKNVLSKNDQIRTSLLSGDKWHILVNWYKDEMVNRFHLRSSYLQIYITSLN